jgi:hypothetical protein
VGHKQILYVPVAELTPHPRNPRKHTRAQIRAIAKSINAFGFNAPILVDKDRQIIGGHARWEGAKLSGLTEVPVVCLEHLDPTQANAYMLADNKLTDRSSWDDTTLAVHLKELSELALSFDIEATGFESPEIDIRTQALEDTDAADKADEFNLAQGSSVSEPGDVWILGSNRVYCGSALDSNSYEALFESETTATAAFTDPPYNVPIDGHVSGNGRIAHREFPMASGEMSEAEFTDFLTTSLSHICAHTTAGALLYICMDWRHMVELHAAGRSAGCDLVNLCVWAKTNGGLGSLYRSRHELVFVYRNGKEAHLNNVQMGRFGRNRTNVWNYPGVNRFARNGSELHPTVKPIQLVAEAILDSTKRPSSTHETASTSAAISMSAARA